MSEEKPVFLYRMFDYSDKLLYVGISQSFFNRVDQHSGDKDWFNDVAIITALRCDSREHALKLEKRAIQDEKPRHNIIHNKMDRLVAVKADNQKDADNSFLVGKLVTQYQPWHGLDIAGLGFQGAIDYRLENGYYGVRLLSYVDGADMYLRLFDADTLATFAIYDSPADLDSYQKKHAKWQESKVKTLIGRLIWAECVDTFSVRSLQAQLVSQFETRVAESLIEHWISNMQNAGSVVRADNSLNDYIWVDNGGME